MHDIYLRSTSLLKKNKISRYFLPYTLISTLQHYRRDNYWYQHNKTVQINIPQYCGYNDKVDRDRYKKSLENYIAAIRKRKKCMTWRDESISKI